MSQKGADKGRYTFSTADAGQHKLCFTADSHANSGWLSGASGPVRLTLDMAIGESNHLESEDKSKLDDLVERVKNLNGRLQDIRREQIFQRVSAYEQDKKLRKSENILTDMYLLRCQ